MNRRVAGGLTAALIVTAAMVWTPTVAQATAGHGKSSGDAFVKTGGANPGHARANARAAARSFVAHKPGVLKMAPGDKAVAQQVVSSHGVQYVPYERTHGGLRVVGGDFVIATDQQGNVLSTSVAQGRRVALASTTPAITAARARAVSQRQVKHAKVEGAPELVVLQEGRSHLAYETYVDGIRHGEPSRLAVYVDARSGQVLSTREHVLDGTGAGTFNGPTPVTIGTTQSGSSYTMKDPNATNLSCQNASNNTTYTQSSDTGWGGGPATDRETACVDALYDADTELRMLAGWDGRDGWDGNGGGWPIRIGDQEENAYYDGTQVQVGYDDNGKWIATLDVLGHELGHGVDDHTPGGISGSGTQEFVADTFGAATEWYANEPSGYDTPDYTVGEEVNLGGGPIRYMYNPSLIGDPNCYSSSVPSSEVHAAAGPGDHWFYLLAEGSNPSDGQPKSPTCNGSTVSGIGIKKANQIMYNAMLLKTSSSSYLKYRTWTLTAAKNLFPNSCTEFNAVKAAWDAVSVPAQSGDPTCGDGGGGGGTGGGGSCTGQILANPGFESGNTGWSATSGVIDSSTGAPAHSGYYKAWFDGYGRSHTDTLSQSVTIPSGCTATLTFYLYVATDESTTTTAYDRFTVKAGSTTLKTYSNLDASSGYVKRTLSLSSKAGSTFTLTFTGTEDSMLATSFLVDDTAVTLG